MKRQTWYPVCHGHDGSVKHINLCLKQDIKRYRGRDFTRELDTT